MRLATMKSFLFVLFSFITTCTKRYACLLEAVEVSKLGN